MFRLIGRFIIMCSGLILVQYSDDFPWWGSILAIALGLIVIEACHRDELKVQGRLL